MNSRAKGARGECQRRDELRANGYRARRGQQLGGSPDSPDVVCDDLPWAHFEVKVVEKLNIYIPPSIRSPCSTLWLASWRFPTMADTHHARRRSTLPVPQALVAFTELDDKRDAVPPPGWADGRAAVSAAAVTPRPCRKERRSRTCPPTGWRQPHCLRACRSAAGCQW